MDQTGLWMLGVGAFGVVFYLLALYYGWRGRADAPPASDDLP
jgi:hypothetical protein